MSLYKRQSPRQVKSTVRKYSALVVTVVAALCLFMPANYASSSVNIFIDFEDYELGPVGGQHGWVSGNPEVSVTDEVYGVSGGKVLQVIDEDTTKAFGASFSFDPIVQGTIEWWGKMDSRSRFIFLLEDTTAGAAKRIDWIAFHGSGKFEYQEGIARRQTSETYQPNEWYRFRVEFDAITKKKTMYIFEHNDLLVLKQELDFENQEAAAINQFRIATISTTVSQTYIDGILIQDKNMEDSELIELRFSPTELTLYEEQQQSVQLLGMYDNGVIRLIQSETTYSSLNSEIATADGGMITGLKEGETTIIAQHEGMSAELPVTVLNKNAIPLYRALTPRPLVRDTELNQLKIIVPEEQGWYNLGQQLAIELNQRWQVNVTVEQVDPELFGGEWSGNVLVLGNLSNNRQMGRLYGLRMSYTDGFFPGPGGYHLFTLVDPFGIGGNTIAIGASDLTGAELAISRVLERIDEAGGTNFPWTAEVSLNPDTASYINSNGNPTPSQVTSALNSARTYLGRLKATTGNEVDAENLQYVLSRIYLYGELYQLTGHEGFGQVYRELLLGYAEFTNRHPVEAMWQLNERRNMWTNGDKVIQSWSVMEASPLFTDEERKLILSSLYLTYEANSRDGYLPGAQAPGPRWNHQIFPALSLVAGSDYLIRYHNLPEARGWIDIGNRVFTNNTSNISLDEGPDYLMHVPMTNIDYAMAVGDESYIRRSLRPSADLHILMLSNLGTMSGGGDNYPFGYSGAFSWGHSQVLNAATWYFGDPIYRYLLELTRNGAFPGQRMSDLTNPLHRYATQWGGMVEQPDPGDYAKLRAYPVDQGVYDDLITKEQEPLTVRLEETFHKMAFRFGFGLDDSYLALDGFSAGAHGHQDGNAIIGYTANGRMFLTDYDYIENTPEHHNGVVVIKDGQQPRKPPLARADWVADLNGLGISRTTIPNYNGADWERTIMSPSGRFFIIYDQLNIQESGSYAFKNMWQTLGTPTLKPDQLTVVQQGVSMTIQSLDRSNLQIHERYGHFQKYFKGEFEYPYADHEVVLSQIYQEQNYQTGDSLSYVNVMSSEKSNESSLKTRRVNDQVIEIKEGDDTWLSVNGAIQTTLLSSNGKHHLISDDLLIAAEVTELVMNGQTLSFAVPMMVELDVATGVWSSYSMLKDHIHYDANGDPIEQGRIDTAQVNWTARQHMQFKAQVAKQGNPSQWKKDKLKYDQPNSDWKKLYEFPGEVTHSAVGSLYGDGEEQLIVGGKNGTVQAVNAQGQLLWSFDAHGRVNEVSIQQLLGETVIFVATEQWRVYALDSAGQLLWSKVFPSDATHKERKGNLIGITSVKVAYVNGYQSDPWIMIGTQFRYLYGLDPSGTEQFNIALYFYGIEDMVFADFAGTGKEEGVIGVEYAYHLQLKDLKEIRNGSGSGPGWKVTELLSDWSGDTMPAVVLGSKQGAIHLSQGKSGRMTDVWSLNVGGEVNDIYHGDFNGDEQTEILVGTSGLQFYNVNADGSVQWRVSTAARVQHVQGWVRKNGSSEYIAAADLGLLYRVNEQGVITRTEQFSSEIAGLHVTQELKRPWIVLLNGTIYESKNK